MKSIKFLLVSAIVLAGISSYAKNEINRQIECTGADNRLTEDVKVKLNYSITKTEGFKASVAQVSIGTKVSDGLKGISEYYPFEQDLDSPRAPFMYAMDMGEKGLMVLRLPYRDLGDGVEGFLLLKGHDEYILDCKGLDVVQQHRTSEH